MEEVSCGGVSLLTMTGIKIACPRQVIAMKVMTIVGTRPELIRLSRIIPLLDRFTDHTLVTPARIMIMS
jgi:hypothetical protein